jgi:DNA (cytosine-5)-methyltransferase 1
MQDLPAYYNEIDPYAAQWLRNLIDAGHIARGDVDERSIADVRPDDLSGYDQCHFFAGIGGWSLALRIAGWDDDRKVWTGSCPCQPLSVAGQRQGHADERHLWPAFYSLIAECQPSIIFGEQVASADGREWIAGIRADLETLGYACGASDLCAAGIGAPQIRQRLYWVADPQGVGSRPEKPGDGASKTKIRWPHPTSSYRGFTDGFGNHYRIPEPSVSFLADGFPGILGRIRAFGNAIVPQVAAAFIECCADN